METQSGLSPRVIESCEGLEEAISQHEDGFHGQIADPEEMRGLLVARNAQRR